MSQLDTLITVATVVGAIAAIVAAVGAVANAVCTPVIGALTNLAIESIRNRMKHRRLGEEIDAPPITSDSQLVCTF